MLKIIINCFYFLIILINFNAYCFNKSQHYQNNSKEKWINIIIHGSVGLQDSFNLSTLISLIKDQVDNTFYQKNVCCIRNNAEIFTTQPISKLGLKPVVFNSYNNIGAYLYSLLYNLISDQYFPNQENQFYTYGWSGLISFKKRLDEALSFYQDLKCLLSKLTRPCKIRIIGYSHGATLAFNLAHIRDTYFPNDSFAIDEIVGIGMPVLRLTEKFAKHIMFKKIYHIYSKTDWVQYLDAFSPCNLTSYKSFYDYDKCPLKHKLVQLDISIYSSLNGLFSEQSLSHSELWFFGWTPGVSYQTSILYPLPLSIFIPYFIYLSKNLDPSFNFTRLKLYPNYNLSKARQKYGYKTVNRQFIHKCQLNFIKQYALKFEPKYHNNINFREI